MGIGGGIASRRALPDRKLLPADDSVSPTPDLSSQSLLGSGAPSSGAGSGGAGGLRAGFFRRGALDLEAARHVEYRSRWLWTLTRYLPGRISMPLTQALI